MDAAIQFYHAFLPGLLFPFQLMYSLFTSSPLVAVLLIFGSVRHALHSH